MSEQINDRPLPDTGQGSGDDFDAEYQAMLHEMGERAEEAAHIQLSPNVSDGQLAVLVAERRLEESQRILPNLPPSAVRVFRALQKATHSPTSH